MIYARNEAEFMRILRISEFQAADYSPSGYLLIIDRLETLAHDSPWAESRLASERRSYNDEYGRPFVRPLRDRLMSTREHAMSLQARSIFA